MNVPTNCREFSLSLAQQNHPLVTRDGRPAKFIAYVPEAGKLHKIVAFMLEDKQLLHFSEEGKPFCAESEYDLFLAPLGYVASLPVFAGDELCLKESSLIFKVPVSAKEYDLSLCKWPSKAPIVETRMLWQDFIETIDSVGNRAGLTISHVQINAVANKAIERAILDGDCVPTAHVLSLMCEAYDMRYQTHDFSFKQNAEFVLKQYLEKLK